MVDYRERIEAEFEAIEKALSSSSIPSSQTAGKFQFATQWEKTPGQGEKFHLK